MAHLERTREVRIYGACSAIVSRSAAGSWRWYRAGMDAPRHRTEVAVDRRGVDRAQIRRMLELSPLERLRWLEEFVESVVKIRRLNDKRAIRQTPPVAR